MSTESDSLRRWLSGLTTSWLVAAPVTKRLVPAVETASGSEESPLSPDIKSEMRPPQPVCPGSIDAEVCCWSI